MLCLAVMVLFGIFAIAKGEIKITKNRKVSGDLGRLLGLILLSRSQLRPDYS